MKQFIKDFFNLKKDSLFQFFNLITFILISTYCIIFLTFDLATKIVWISSLICAFANGIDAYYKHKNDKKELI